MYYDSILSINFLWYINTNDQSTPTRESVLKWILCGGFIISTELINDSICSVLVKRGTVNLNHPSTPH